MTEIVMCKGTNLYPVPLKVEEEAMSKQLWKSLETENAKKETALRAC